MSQPNLELVQEKVESSLNSAPMGAWPEPGSKGAKSASLIAIVAIIVSFGSAGWQMMQSKKMVESMNVKMKDSIAKALDAERKKNNLQAQLTDALDKMQKQNQDAMDSMKKEVTQQMTDGMTAMNGRLDKLEASATRAPASKKGGKAAKKRHR